MIKRRTVVLLCGLLSSGCLGGETAVGVPHDIIIWNKLDHELNATIEVTRLENGDVQFEDDFRMGGAGINPASIEYENPIAWGGRHEIQLSFSTRNNVSKVWDFPKRAGSDRQSRYYGLEIVIDREIEFNTLHSAMD